MASKKTASNANNADPKNFTAAEKAQVKLQELRAIRNSLPADATAKRKAQLDAEIKQAQNEAKSASTAKPANDNGNVNGVAPTIVFDENGQPVKNPDGSYKTAVGATMPEVAALILTSAQTQALTQQVAEARSILDNQKAIQDKADQDMAASPADSPAFAAAKKAYDEAQQKIDAATGNANKAVATLNEHNVKIQGQSKNLAAKAAQEELPAAQKALDEAKKKLNAAPTSAALKAQVDAAQKKLEDLHATTSNIATNSSTTSTPEGFTLQAPLRYDAQGRSLIPGTAAYNAGSSTRPAAPGATTGGTTGGTSGSSSSSTSTKATPSPATPVDLTTPNYEGTPLQGAAGYNADAKSQQTADQNWVQQYGGIAAMALTIPWMKSILTQAISGRWDATKFTNAIKTYTVDGVSPWTQLGASYRNSTIDYFNDKASWARQYNDKLAILQKSAVDQGLDPSVFGQEININDSKSIDAAYKDQHSGVNTFFNTYYGNMPDMATIDKYVANHTGLAKTDQNVYAGVIGQNIDTLKAYANDMGIASQYLPAQQGGAGDYFSNVALNIQKGTTTLQEQQNYLRDQAAAMYTPFANRIKEGMSVRALASPYINAASNLLENTDPNAFDLGSTTGYGSMVTKAMQGDGTTPMSLDKFVTSVKQRPEWLQTSNARNSLMDTATSLLRNFGMVTGG